MKSLSGYQTMLAVALIAFSAAGRGDEQNEQQASAYIRNSIHVNDIADWQAKDSSTLLLRAHGGSRAPHYAASFSRPCDGILNAEEIRFDTGGNQRVDRFAAVVLNNGQRCTIATIERQQDGTGNASITE